MNTFIGKSNTKSTNIHIASRVVATAVGATLALTAIAGLSGQLDSSKAASELRSIYAPAATPIPTSQSQLRVVLVATEEQQKRLEAAFVQDQYLTSSQPIPLMVVVKGSALEQSLTSASGDVAGSGTSVQVTDTTMPVTSVTSPR